MSPVQAFICSFTTIMACGVGVLVTNWCQLVARDLDYWRIEWLHDEDFLTPFWPGSRH